VREGGGMDANAQMALQALTAVYEPTSTNERRQEAYHYLEQVKAAPPETSLQIAEQLIRPELPDRARHFGLALVGVVIEKHWRREDFSTQKAQIKQLILTMMARGTKPLTEEPGFIKEKLCGLLSAVGCREWPQRWPEMFEQIFELGSMGHTQAELALISLRLVGEEIMEFNDNLDGKRRSDLSQALRLTMPRILPWVRDAIQSNYSALAVAVAAEGGGSGTAAALRLLVGTALQLLQSYCQWVSLGLLHGSRFLPLCCVSHPSSAASPRSALPRPSLKPVSLAAEETVASRRSCSPTPTAVCAPASASSCSASARWPR
jgi:hypothetical protein